MLSDTYNPMITSKHKSKGSASYKQWEQPCEREVSSRIYRRRQHYLKTERQLYREERTETIRFQCTYL